MTEADVKEILRSKAMCGHVSAGFACILPRHHDDDVHERGWTVVRRTVSSAHKLDYRDPDDVVYDVREAAPVGPGYRKVFSTENKDHADWLASTLTRLEQ